MLTPQPGSVIASRYRLDRALAHGGMGSVWVGHHLQLDVPIALKFMDAAVAASPDLRMRFEREAKAAAKLRSPHIIQVHDYGVEEGTPYIVMELLDGEDLDTRLRGLGRLSVPSASAIVTQIAKALRSAHEAGIVHRDLKPANVFLCRHHDEEVVKVLDFGIAKTTGEAQAGPGTATGVVMGSVHYMSPEQTRAAKDLDGRSDLWSLGVILYRCVTGRLPFLGDQISAVFVAICMDPIRWPSQVVPGLGPEVDQFFARALARDPAQRFQTARELADAFAALASTAGNLAIPAPRPVASSVEEASNDMAPSVGTFMSSQRTLPALPMRRTGALLPAAGAALILAAIGGAMLFLRPCASPRASTTTTDQAAAPPATASASASPPASTSASPPATSPQPTASTIPTASAMPLAATVSAPPAPSSAHPPQIKPPQRSPKDPKLGF